MHVLNIALFSLQYVSLWGGGGGGVMIGGRGGGGGGGGGGGAKFGERSSWGGGLGSNS